MSSKWTEIGYRNIYGAFWHDINPHSISKSKAKFNKGEVILATKRDDRKKRFVLVEQPRVESPKKKRYFIL